MTLVGVVEHAYFFPFVQLYVNMLELEVMPERGLSNGQWELTLGTPLVQAVKILQSNYSSVKSVQLSYSDQKPLQHSIVLNLTDDGIRAVFDSKSQLLTFIEVYDMRKVKLKYCNSTFSAPGITPTLELIRRCFGPTRAGDKNIKHHLYLLLFRGIVFVFPLLWNNSSQQCVFDSDELEFSEPSVEGSLVLSKLRIFTGNNPSQPQLPCIPSEYYKAHSYTDMVQGIRDSEQGYITRLKLTLRLINDDVIQSRSLVDTDIKDIDRIVSFQDTPQDVMSLLGSPSRVYYKDEDKMKIHSSSTHKQPISNASDYFYNYYTLGMDILFDGRRHCVKKFVLHTNYPGHFNFNSYHRCQYSLSFISNPDTTNDSQLINVSAFTKWNEVQELLASTEEKPVVLTRSSSTNNTNPFGYTYCYNHENVIFEVMKNNHIASVVIFQPIH